MKKNKGITLIALIITIIILLILVGVSFNLLIKGNLFGSAEKAVTGTNAKVEEQQNRVDGLMDILEDVNAKNYKHNWQYTDETRAQIRCTCTICKSFNDGDSMGRTLSIGQQIGETQNITASTSIIKEKSGYDYEQTLELDAEPTAWVVFGYDDQDKDGKNEVLLLTTVTSTEKEICFILEAGYNNGIEEVNRMCRELYGSNARGITIEDINRVLGYNPEGGMYYLNSKWSTVGNFDTKLKDLGDMWTAIINYNTTEKAGVFYDPSHTEGISDNGAYLGEYALNGYSYSNDDIPDVIADAPRSMIFGCNYYLASRGVNAGIDRANFGNGVVSWGDVENCCGMYHSNGRYYPEKTSEYNSLRPLISLTSDIPAAGEVLYNN